MQAVPTVVLLQDGKAVDSNNRIIKTLKIIVFFFIEFVGLPAEDKLTAFLAKANSYSFK